MRILFVGKEDLRVSARTPLLEDAGFAVDLMHVGRAGNRKIDPAEYDVIVLDMTAPELGGPSALRDWRQTAGGPRRSSR